MSACEKTHSQSCFGLSEACTRGIDDDNDLAFKCTSDYGIINLIMIIDNLIMLAKPYLYMLIRPNARL